MIAGGAAVDVDSDGLAKGYNHIVVGLMGGYAHTSTDLKLGSVDVNTGWGGLYAGYFNHGCGRAGYDFALRAALAKNHDRSGDRLTLEEIERVQIGEETEIQVSEA